MKKLFLPLICTVYLFSNNPISDEKKEFLVKDIKVMFDKIGEKRVGVYEGKVDALTVPFLEIRKSKKETAAKKENQTPVLQAIFNKKVKVNGQWFRLYEKIGEFKIVSIKESYILLKNSEKKLKLSIRKKNENIKFK